MPCIVENRIAAINGNISNPCCENMEHVNGLHVNYGPKLELAKFVCKKCTDSHCGLWRDWNKSEIEEMNSRPIAVDILDGSSDSTTPLDKANMDEILNKFMNEVK